METDLLKRLSAYRDVLDVAIAADLAQRRRAEPPGHSPRRLAAAAVAITVLGVGALVWAARQTDSAVQVDDATASVDVTLPVPTDDIQAPLSAPISEPPPDSSPSIKPPGGAALRPLTVGDSVMLGAASELEARGFAVDAVQSRQLPDTIMALERLRDEGRFGDIVVVSVGLNGTIRHDQLDQLMNALIDVEFVYVVTNTGPAPWLTANNQLLRELPLRYANVTLIDWEQKSAACPGDCFYADDTHLRLDGQRFYAELITNAVGRATVSGLVTMVGGPPNTPDTPISGTVQFVDVDSGVTSLLNAGEDGTFFGSVAVGRYTITATSPRFASDRICAATADPIAIEPGTTTEVTILCPRR